MVETFKRNGALIWIHSTLISILIVLVYFTVAYLSINFGLFLAGLFTGAYIGVVLIKGFRPDNEKFNNDTWSVDGKREMSYSSILYWWVEMSVKSKYEYIRVLFKNDDTGTLSSVQVLYRESIVALLEEKASNAKIN